MSHPSGPKELLQAATWGRHAHSHTPVFYLFIYFSFCQHSPTVSGGSLPSHRLPLLLSSFSLSLLFHPSLTPRLLKSAAIKTDAGLKCHGCISNCQNINLFTPSCPASFSFFQSVLRGNKGEGSWKKGARAGEEDVAVRRQGKGEEEVGGVSLAGGGVSCHLFRSCRRLRGRDLTT